MMLVKSAIAVLALASAVAAAPRGGNRNSQGGRIRQKGVHYKDGIFPAPNVEELAAASSSGLTYYGGPVIANINVNPIYYGGNVNYQSQMDTFYSAIVGSSYISWLSEYNTPTQSIGTGSFGTSISKSSGLSTSTTDAAIQTWLRSLVQSGTLKPTANTYYPIHFAPGYSISMGSDSSCVQFCAYHGTIDVSDISSTKYLYYGVMPDQGGSCAGGCGSNPSALNNLQSVSSHELVEALTDAAVGVATTIGAPIAWYNSANGEIGDLCNAQQGSVIGTDGNSYVVQKQWSNSHNGCYVPSGSPPPPPPTTKATTTTTKTTTTPAKTTTTTAKTTTTPAKTTTTSAPTPSGLPHSGSACPTFGQYACGDQNDVLVCVNNWIQLTVCPSGTKCSPGSYVCI